MTVNHGGALQPEYFKAYLSLIMLSHNCDIACAKDYMVDHFFHGNERAYGSFTRNSFYSAVYSFQHN